MPLNGHLLSVTFLKVRRVLANKSLHLTAIPLVCLCVSAADRCSIAVGELGRWVDRQHTKWAIDTLTEAWDFYALFQVEPTVL